MDTATVVGRYGTLKLMSNKNENEVIATFPIDDEEVTFGRGQDCSVRLYYSTVSEIHSKIIFEDKKAFLVVLGRNGLLVDGAFILPSSNHGADVTIPLTNGTNLEIHKKKFQFWYPPKEHRQPYIFTTPAAQTRRRSMRLSMIHAAQIFTPSVPKIWTPAAQIERLRSPIRSQGLQEGDDIDVCLLQGDGDNSTIIHEDKDVIVLEEVDRLTELPPPPINANPRTPVRPSRAFPVPQPIMAPPMPMPTPSPKRRCAPSLHKAVLVKSAKLAYEKQMEEEAEEQEVEEVVSPERELGADEDWEHRDEDEENNRTPTSQTLMANFEAARKTSPIEPTHNDQIMHSPMMEMMDSFDEDEEESNTPAQSTSTPVASKLGSRRPLGPFMTPQQPSQGIRPRISAPLIPPAGSFGGARRVPLIGMPEAPTLANSPPKAGVGSIWNRTSSAVSERSEIAPSPSRPIVTDEERRAIQQKRSSKIPDDLMPPLPSPLLSRTFDQPVTLTTSSSLPDDQSDINSLLQRVREQAQNLRRNSIAAQSQGRPSLSPTKQGFSLFASPVRPVAPVVVKQTPTRPLRDDAISIFEEEITEVQPAPTHVLYKETTPVKPPVPAPETPPFLDLKHMFGKATASATPRFDGMLAMFKSPAKPTGPETPALKGLRELYRKDLSNRGGLPTPVLEGVGETFAQDEEEENDENEPPIRGPLNFLSVESDESVEHENEDVQHDVEGTQDETETQGMKDQVEVEEVRTAMAEMQVSEPEVPQPQESSTLKKTAVKAVPKTAEPVRRATRLTKQAATDPLPPRAKTPTEGAVVHRGRKVAPKTDVGDAPVPGTSRTTRARSRSVNSRKPAKKGEEDFFVDDGPVPELPALPVANAEVKIEDDPKPTRAGTKRKVATKVEDAEPRPHTSGIARPTAATRAKQTKQSSTAKATKAAKAETLDDAADPLDAISDPESPGAPAPPPTRALRNRHAEAETAPETKLRRPLARDSPAEPAAKTKKATPASTKTTARKGAKTPTPSNDGEEFEKENSPNPDVAEKAATVKTTKTASATRSGSGRKTPVTDAVDGVAAGARVTRTRARK